MMLGEQLARKFCVKLRTSELNGHGRVLRINGIVVRRMMPGPVVDGISVRHSSAALRSGGHKPV